MSRQFRLALPFVGSGGPFVGSGGWLAAIVLSVTLCSGAAGAATPQEKAAARSAAEAGVAAFKAEEYEKAIELLSRAEKLVHAPPHLLYMGRSYFKLGKLVLANEVLSELVNEQLSADDPKAFEQSQEIGRELMDEIEPLLARVTVRVEGAEADAKVLMDGAEIPTAAIGIPYPVDPGQRKFLAEADNMTSEEVVVDLASGDSTDVVLTLVPVEPAPVKAKKEPIVVDDGDPPPPVPAEPEKKSGLSPLTWVGIGVTGAGLVVGISTGLASMGKTSSVKEDFCTGNICTSDADGGIKSAKALGTVSNIGFGVAVAGVALTVYGLVSGKPSKGESAVAASGLTPRLDVEAGFDAYRVGARWIF